METMGSLLPPTRPRPVIGAAIRIDAFPEANAVTDARGYFILTNMPAPEFFVHVDGTTATNDPAMFRQVCVRFPPGSARDNLGRPWLLAIDHWPFAEGAVPPDRISAPLPPNLNPRLVISVQAMLPDGAAAADLRFTIDDLRFPDSRTDERSAFPFEIVNRKSKIINAPALFFSFNHAAGRWDVIGAGTATTHGTIESDPGVGIRVTT